MGKCEHCHELLWAKGKKGMFNLSACTMKEHYPAVMHMHLVYAVHRFI